MIKYIFKGDISFRKNLHLNYTTNKFFKIAKYNGKKIEKSNGVLTYHQQENTNRQKFLKNEKKSLFFFFKSTEKQAFAFSWDIDKKLINLPDRLKHTGMFISKKAYIHIEEYLSLKTNHKPSEIYGKTISSTLRWIIRAYNSSLSFQEVLLFMSFKNFNYSINRFYMRTECLLNPNFICWSGKKDTSKIFYLIIYKLGLAGNFSYDISAFCAMIKPSVLKIACFGKSSFVFFSIESGFSFYCPLYMKKTNKQIICSTKI
nr:hypothetical protein 1634Bnrm1_p100 [Cryptomonas sp.]